MKRVLIISFIFIGMISCKKENHLPDNILFTEFNPQIELTSVDSFVLHPSLCGYYPVPENSYLEYPIDFDKNDIYDLMLIMETRYEYVSASNPCSNYQYRITLEGINEKSQVTSTEHENLPIFLNINDKIDNSLEWNTRTFLMMDEAYVPFYYDFSGDKYIGIKLTENENSYYGWLYLNKTSFKIFLISYGLNLTANNSIKVGQTE